MDDSKDTSIQTVEPPVAPKRGLRRTVLLILAIVFGVVVYAYGFDVTNVDAIEDLLEAAPPEVRHGAKVDQGGLLR